MALFRRGRVWWMGFPYHGKQVRRSTEVTDKKLAEKIYHKVMVQRLLKASGIRLKQGQARP